MKQCVRSDEKSRVRPFGRTAGGWAIVGVLLVACVQNEEPLGPGDGQGDGGDSDEGTYEIVDVPPNAGQDGCALQCDRNLGVLNRLPDDLCEAIAVAETAYFTHCYKEYLEAVPLSEYIGLIASWCRDGHLIEGLPGQASWTSELEATYKACLLAFVNAPCGCEVTCMTALSANPYIGMLADGASCQQSTQCRSGFCNAPFGECGVCESLSDGVPLGGVCEWDWDCADGLYCQDDTAICMAEKGTCDACTSDDECGGRDACINGECAYPYLGEGERCADALGGCRVGLSCRHTGGADDDPICAPYAVYADVGEPCNVDVESTYSLRAKCNGFAYCDAEENGVCVARGVEGEPCEADEYGDSTCLPFLACVDGICGYPDLNCQ